MFRKFFSDTFQAPEPVVSTQPKESVPMQTISKPELPAHKKCEEEDDLFKEMQPNYIAPKRIGPAVSSVTESAASKRFEMEVDHTNSWEVEELN